MKAITISTFGPPSVLTIKDLPAPTPQPHHVLVAIRAFGLNHAEMHMRRGEWAESHPISGIECVGTVVACPDGPFTPGMRVAALMGGLGRSIPGTYAQFVNVPVANVVDLSAAPELPWEDLAALPESYATAWTCLFRNLELRAGQTLVVRGATSALGLAAVNLAVQAGVKVVATVRNEARRAMLMERGVQRVVLERADLAEYLKGTSDGEGQNAADRVGEVDAVLNLLGNSALLDSLRMPRRGGRVCQAGFLAGLGPLPAFDPLTQMASGVQFSFFGSFVFGAPGFALGDVPLAQIVRDVAEGRFKGSVKPSRVWRFEQIVEAHEVMERGEAGGKMVVLVGE